MLEPYRLSSATEV